MNGLDSIDPSEFQINDDELELIKQRIMRKRLAESLQDNKSEMAEPILGAIAGGIDVLARHSAAQLDPVATITGLPIKGYVTPNAAGEFQKALAVRQNKTKTRALDETQMLKNLEDIKTNRIRALAEAAYKQQKNLTDLYKAQQWAEISKQNAKTAAEKAKWDMESKAIANAIQQQRADTYAAEQRARSELIKAQIEKYGAETEQIQALTPEKVAKMGAETGLIGEKTETESVLRDPRADLLRAQAEAARARAKKEAQPKQPGQPKITATQESAANFAMSMIQANKIIDDIEKSGAPITDATTHFKNLLKESAPFGLGQASIPEWYKKQKQAELAFINAILRKESGAAVPEQEYARYKMQYFPAPGDSPEVLAQKRANRLQAIENLKAEAGPALQKRVSIENVAPIIQQPAKITREEALKELKRRGRIK